MHRLILSGLLSLCLNNCAWSNTTHPAKHITTRDLHQAVQQVIGEYAPFADAELQPYFQQASIHYPPKKIALLTFKKERKVELWAKDKQHPWSKVLTYPLTASSGQLGPKLRYHDDQIPEGIYRVVAMNPFSNWHLSMKLNYPNEFDIKHARQDGRTNLGGDIFIHGKDLSVGCLAVGDVAIDQLFVLVGRVGTGNTEVIIAPNDMRQESADVDISSQPSWVPELYADISEHLAKFKGA
jgi:murein L,D-transpeptidase YafK